MINDRGRERLIYYVLSAKIQKLTWKSGLYKGMLQKSIKSHVTILGDYSWDIKYSGNCFSLI